MMISISILSCDDRVMAVKKINRTNADKIHIDVMDGKFVSNYQFSTSEVNELLELAEKEVDIHLMCKEPLEYIKGYSSGKIGTIFFHLETAGNKEEIIAEIRSRGYSVGIAVNPMTSVEDISYLLDKIDAVLMLSVEPGFGGQAFLKDSLERIRSLKQIIDENKYKVMIQVDGGIKDYNIKDVYDAGCDVAVVGSFVVSNGDYQFKINELQEKIKD